MKCSICFEIMHDPVTLMPCLHNFCGGCISGWVRLHKDCPHCRLKISDLKKNVMLNQMIAIFSQANPEEKRSNEDIKDIDDQNIFKDQRVYKLAEASKLAKGIA
jgi:E3 ubiquitin-protein ligase CHFR